MKLSSQQVAVVKDELGADPLGEENPAMESLKNAFGDHTFYVGSDGLFVFESVNEPEQAREPAQLVLVASWTDDQKTALEKIPPQQTDKVIDLAGSTGGPDKPDGGEAA